MLKKLVVIASLPALFLAARFIPFDGLPSTCAFLHLTGYPCPTCGMTRSVMALAHLDLGRAMQMNSLGLAFVGSLGLWWTNSIYQMAVGRQTRLAKWVLQRMNLLAAAAFAVLLLFGALRIVFLIG